MNKDFKHIVGKTLKEAKELLSLEGMTIRAVSVDGKPCTVTRDARSNRLNVSVKKDKIVIINGIG